MLKLCSQQIKFICDNTELLEYLTQDDSTINQIHLWVLRCWNINSRRFNFEVCRREICHKISALGYWFHFVNVFLEQFPLIFSHVNQVLLWACTYKIGIPKRSACRFLRVFFYYFPYRGCDILSDADITCDVPDLLCILRKVENMIYYVLSDFWCHAS